MRVWTVIEDRARIVVLIFEMTAAGFSGSDVADLAEARACAMRAIHALLTTPGPEDWREWMLHVSDEEGEEIFSVPFASVLGKPH